ncbi:hypothetical protein [Legionella pneumophila]|nr:hypothetical protein [Legionella pneumophila]
MKFDRELIEDRNRNACINFRLIIELLPQVTSKVIPIYIGLR